MEVQKQPAGLHNAYLFATFNALSFQCVLGSPMVLYAKSLGASATVLGIIAGMMPLLVISQIPAANYIPKFGYKRFVLGGWTTRVAFIFVIALVPLGDRLLAPATLLSLILFLLFLFNMSRGISSCAWLPWITGLVPPETRGRFLATEQAFIGIASCLAFVLAAAILGAEPANWEFSLVFLMSGVFGGISLRYLKRIPDVPLPDEPQSSNQGVPWKTIATYRPFARLLILNLGWAAAYGGTSTFTVAFLKVKGGLGESTILFLSSVFFLGGLLSLSFGPHLDRFGSKPIFSFVCVLWFLLAIAWVLIAGKFFAPNVYAILTLQFTMGMGAALFSMANTRLAMNISPEMGRSHFFALYSVVINLTLGLSPVLWGLFIDILRQMETTVGHFELNRYTLFFAGSALMFIVTLFLSFRLEEPRAGKLEHLLREVLLEQPSRMILRLWPR